MRTRVHLFLAAIIFTSRGGDASRGSRLLDAALLGVELSSTFMDSSVLLHDLAVSTHQDQSGRRYLLIAVTRRPASAAAASDPLSKTISLTSSSRDEDG